MSCMCIMQLAAIAGRLKSLPLAMLLDLLPRIQAGSAGTMSLSANVSAAAAASAAASASVSASASAALSASALARLEALAYVSGSLGFSPLSVDASARMSVTSGSISANAPNFIAALLAFLNPIIDLLNQLLAMLQGIQSIYGLTGINLGLPNVGASLGAYASASASASASANLSANVSALARLDASARALGIDLSLPGGAARLNAMLSAAASFQPPTLPMVDLSKLLGAMHALSSANALGLDMLGKWAAAQLAALLQNLLGNLSAAAQASASASASISASAAASANLSAVAAAAASLNASALARLPNLTPMSMALNLSAQINASMGINMFASGPCSSCRFF